MSSDRREHPSPDRRWSVVFHKRREFHMGADGWRVRLLHHGIPAWGHRRQLLRLSGSEGFRCEDDLRPWSHDGKTLAFVTWREDPVHIYDVAAKKARCVPCGRDFVHSVQWSSSVDRLLVTSATGAGLFDQGGTRRGTVTWTIAPGERPHTDWMREGDWFFVLARESKSAKVMLTFHAAEDGAVGDSSRVDPGDLVPYDADRFAGLPRDRFCLMVTASGGAVGELLDTWHGAQFHQPSNTLYLAVYRPIVSAAAGTTEGFCPVEERWVAVELGS